MLSPPPMLKAKFITRLPNRKEHRRQLRKPLAEDLFQRQQSQIIAIGQPEEAKEKLKLARREYLAWNHLILTFADSGTVFHVIGIVASNTSSRLLSTYAFTGNIIR